MYLQGKLICTAFLLFLCSAQAKAPPTSGGKSVLSDASSTVTPEIEVPAQPVLADIPLLSEIGHNPTADTIKADFQVSAAGSSTYRVPLVFPAGIAGTTPQISFSYDSQSGNGPLGVGWQLSGLSTISRCRKTLSEDGYFAAIKFNQQDAICLDGRRLTLVSGSEWSNQATYHTKIETGQRVRLLHNAGNIYFSVNRPDGSKYIYGNSSDSIQKDLQSNQVYSWHLSEIIDASGNKIEFEYINGERHQALLSKIEYSGNVVNFNYGSLRLDKKSGYFQGNKFYSDMRLNNVITTNHNGVVISSYHLDYIYSSNTRSSLLNVLQQCNGKREDEGGSCMKTTFGHNDNLYYPTKVRNIDLEDFVAGEKIQKILSADVNGDGKSDYVFSYGVGDNIKIKVALLFNSFSIVDGFDVFARSGFSLADTDGDGAAEIIVRDYDGNNESEVIYHWSGNFDGGFFEAETVDPSIKDHGTFGADFDGNGLPDRQNLQQHWLNKNNTWTSISSFSGADLLSFLGHNDFDTNGGLTRVTHESMSDATGGSVDFNSDGIPDIFNVTLRTSITVDNPTEPDCMDTNICRLDLIYDAVSIGTSASDIFISENLGNFGYSGELNDSNPVPNYVFPDINGDGNADVFDMSGSSNTANQGVLKGTGLQSEAVTPPPYRMFSWYADVNMDGADDYIFKPDAGDVLYYKTFDSANNTWSEDIELPNSFRVAEKITGGRQVVNFSDVNGDGLYDYSVVDLDEKFIWVQYGVVYEAGIDLITSINESDVKGINIEYMGAMVNYGTCGKRGGSFYRDDEVHCVYVSSDESILQPGAFGSAIVNLNPALNLVKISRKINFNAYESEEYNPPISTAYNSYQYKGYHIQAGGVGSLGFESILVFDGMSNTTTISDYHQEYPFTGMLKKKNVYSSPNGEFVFDDESKLLSSYVVQEIADIGLNSNKTRFISNKKSLEKAYTINFQGDTLSSDNVYIKSVTSDNIFEAVADAYVNLASASQTRTDELNAISYTISNSYEYTQDDISKWWVGKVTKQVTNHQRTGAYTSGDAVSRTMAYTYYSDNGLLENEIIEPDGDNKSYLKTHFKYDSFGNKTATTQCSLSFASQCDDDVLPSTMANSADIFRRQNSIFDTDGRYLKEVQISGLTQQYFDQYNQLGKPTSIRLLQNDVPVQTDIFYDDFGREYFRRSADGSAVSTAIAKNDGNGPAQAAYQITVASNVAPTTKQYLGATGNIFRSSTQSFDGRWIHVDTKYDESNRKISESVPYFSGEPEPASSSLGYDGLNRLKRQTAADGTETSFEYIALTTKKNVVASYSGVLVSWSAVVNRSSSTMTNAFGEIIKVIDEHGKQQTFSYDAVGNADLLTGVDGIQIDPDFDGYGRRTALNDPNKGNWQFSYNGLGELIKTTAPDSIVTEEFRDNQGRVRLRTVTKGSDVETSQFVYQGQRLTGTTVTGGPQQNFGYDQLGRPNSTTTLIDSLTFTSSKTYDEFGRVFQHFDASGNSRGLRYGYNDYGYLLFMREAATGVNGTKYYEVQAMDERGNVTSSQAGNGLNTLRNFDQKTGFMKDIQTGTAGQVQSLAYEFDGVGNLRARIDYNNLDITDTTQSLHEEFDYDDLNRLTTVKRNLAGNLLTTQQLSYDDNGNILTKSDMQAGATYDYSTRPAQCSSTSLVGGHSVQQIGQFSYCYDGRGNQTHQYKDATLQRQVDYSNFDLPVKITSLTGTTRFTYDIERKRIKRVDTENSGTTTTYYLDNVEYQLLPGGSHQYRRYLGDAAIEIVRSNGTVELSYLHRDHLGSVDVISNTAGQKSQCLSFDAFGKRRQCRGWNPVTDAYAELSLGTLLAITPRGFTGHEHVDHAEVIHMNGRIYDPQAGRFMQADPIVQAPEHSQSPNRYSYVFNNPLSYTDPTGYEAYVLNPWSDWRSANGDWLSTMSDLPRATTRLDMKKYKKLNGAFGNSTPVDSKTEAGDANKVDRQQTGPTDQIVGSISNQQGTFKSSYDLKTTEDNYSAMPESLRKEIIEKVNAAYIEHGLNGIFVGERAEEIAALAYANAINPISMEYNIEIGARIFTDSENGIAYLGSSVTSYHSNFIHGDAYSRSTVIGSTIGNPQWSAYIHTHSRASLGSDEFTGMSATSIGRGYGGDLPIAAFWAKNSYVVTPQGNLHKFTFAKWKDGVPMGNPNTISNVSNRVKVWEK